LYIGSAGRELEPDLKREIRRGGVVGVEEPVNTTRLFDVKSFVLDRGLAIQLSSDNQRRPCDVSHRFETRSRD